MESERDVVTIGAPWNNPPGDIRADLKKLRDDALKNAGYQPGEREPIILSPSRFEFLLSNGYITPEGHITEAGKKWMAEVFKGFLKDLDSHIDGWEYGDGS